MPLIRKQYTGSSSNFKPAGIPLLGDGQYTQSDNNYASPGAPRMDEGFVNTDRLVGQNADLINKTRDNINSFSGDIDKTGADVRSDINKPQSFGTPQKFSVKDLLDLSIKDPTIIKNAYDFKGTPPTDVKVDDSKFGNLLTKISGLAGSTGLNETTPDPYKYGLLRTGGALNENTLTNYADRVKKLRSDTMSEADTTNAKNKKDYTDLVTGNTDDITTKIKGILAEGLPQLNDNRKFGPVTIGGNELTGVLGGKPEERDSVVKSLKYLAGIIGVDPNTVGATPLDNQWLAALEKHKQDKIKADKRRKELEEIRKDDLAGGEGTSIGGAASHVYRARNPQHIGKSRDYSGSSVGFGINGRFVDGDY